MSESHSSSDYMSLDEGEGSGFIGHIPAILSQRRYFVIIPFLVIAIAGIVAAFLLPTLYRSTAVLVVESQDLPADVVGSPVTSLIDQRVAKIRQQVLSRGDLIELIQQNDLYETERKTKPLSTVVEKMRDSTSVEAVTADIGQNPNGQKSNTIAFSISFDYKDPVKAQLVVQSFVDSFLEQASTQTAKQAQSTVAFLNSQAGDLQKQIADIEGQITTIKAQNGVVLSGAGMATSASPGSYDAQIAALLRDNAVAAQQARTTMKDPGVAAAEQQLAAARAIYSESHPDVKFARQRLDEARRLAAANPTTQSGSSAGAQIAANNAQIAALGRARSQDYARSATVSAAQARAPVVMERVAQLEARASALREQYQTISTRLLDAQNSAKMEIEDKGERLSVSDPPVVPDKPVSTNRWLLMGAAIGGGLFAGLFLALLVELILKPIRGVGQVEALLGVGPLVVIPTLTKGSNEPKRPFFGALADRIFFWRRFARAGE